MPEPRIDPIHGVTNQSTPCENYDSYGTDRPLVEAVQREGAGWAAGRLAAAARVFTDSGAFRLAALANEHPPVLHTHDNRGHRSDTVEFHPAWHELLSLAVGNGLVASPWTEQRAGSHVARAAMFYLYAQLEAGSQCPIAMSYGVVPVLRAHADVIPSIRELWLPKLLSGIYDARYIPAPGKNGVLFGMGMTERQCGSDVRRTVTQAEPLGKRGVGRTYRITGHKWFMSAPMCDAFLVLAQTGQGVSCFLLPRFRERGSANALCFQRLKQKLGNRSNASSEVEFHGAEATLLGDEGRGIPVIIEMAGFTRLDCVLATAGMQRRALSIALHHAAARQAFGAPLMRKPLMANVLADMAIETEATTSLAMYLAHCFDPASADEDRMLGRLLTPACKFHVCKRGPQFAAEAMEVLGGNGYVEEYELPRLYRELPLLSIWEGAGNVMCLDVLRVLAREPEAMAVLRQKIADVAGEHPAYDRFVVHLEALLTKPSERDGRRIAHAVTLAMTGALLLRHAPEIVASTYCSTRLVERADWGSSFGTLPPDVPLDALLERAGIPALS